VLVNFTVERSFKPEKEEYSENCLWLVETKHDFEKPNFLKPQLTSITKVNMTLRNWP